MAEQVLPDAFKEFLKLLNEFDDLENLPEEDPANQMINGDSK